MYAKSGVLQTIPTNYFLIIASIVGLMAVAYIYSKSFNATKNPIESFDNCKDMYSENEPLTIITNVSSD